MDARSRLSAFFHACPTPVHRHYVHPDGRRVTLPRLVDYLADMYPKSTHVYHIGLDRAPDLAVWNFARDEVYVIVSRDSDFSDLSTLLGFPPKVVWIRLETARPCRSKQSCAFIMMPSRSRP
jgi:predicted nuclease of predicted toxin-antitoxin system